MTAKDVLKLAKEKGAKIVDLRFIDLPGLWQHFSIPVSELNEGIFEDGLGFDGSSIRGFQTIDESDMLLIPDPASAVMDPFTAVPTLVLICNGEIFNYIELREGLIKRGHRFRTASDVEVILHLYEEQGMGFLNELNGQFAFALYDLNQRTLF